METNEQGLTKEERLMFGLLGIILIVAIGVLTVKSFSENERVLEETPITENKGQDDINEDITSKSDSSLIEETTENNVSKKYNASYTASRNNSLLAAVTNKEKETSSSTKPKKEQDGTGSTNPSIYDTWNFKNNIVTKAYKGETIIIDKNILLSDGSEREAQVTVRKLIDDTYMIVDTSEGYIIATPGVYRYSYTYANVTKELVLTVYDYIEPDSVSLLNVNDEIIDDSVNQEEFNSIKETLKNTNIAVFENKLNITVKQTSTSYHQIPLLITMKNLTQVTDISTSTLGTIVTREKTSWYQNISENQFILFINTDILKSNEIIVSIDGTTYILNINITITLEDKEDDKDDKEEDKSDLEDKNDENQENPDEGPKPGEEVEINDDNYINENTMEENIVVATIVDNADENTSQ